MIKPPFTISNKMLSLSISITEKITSINQYQSLKRMPILRRNTRIKSVHASLAIEANLLSIDEVRDVISGKAVLGPKQEIQEVKNAYKAYEMIKTFEGYQEEDLLKAHKVLMDLIDDNAGNYRKKGVGVFKKDIPIFIAPPEGIVPQLMKNLFEWLRKDQDTPILIKSCIFHYELVFIHPFMDGNGRTARLWQNILLTKWNPIFEYIPIESQIQKYQDEYYSVIDMSNKEGKSDRFIEFMLKIIDETLSEINLNLKKDTRNISDQVSRLLDIMDPDIPLSANEIMARLGIKSKETLRASYLNPALENGLIKMTIPDKPKSKNQKYIK
ncbi:MAG TPA: Fic family protein [Acholeplasmataceae bacterium]|nr:Fic family protein [Acholeplasmataceae bacterium]